MLTLLSVCVSPPAVACEGKRDPLCRICEEHPVRCARYGWTVETVTRYTWDGPVVSEIVVRADRRLFLMNGYTWTLVPEPLLSTDPADGPTAPFYYEGFALHGDQWEHALAGVGRFPNQKDNLWDAIPDNIEYAQRHYDAVHAAALLISATV